MNIKDYATGVVATAPVPATSGTSLVLSSGQGARMPAVPFKATIHPQSSMPDLDTAEKVLVTNINVDTLTIVRAQGETTAKSIENGWRLSNALFEEDLSPIGKLLNDRVITKEPTGFTSPADVIITYDSTTQTVTLTGTVKAYYQGVDISVANPTFVSGWQSPPHTNSVGVYFLYFDGTNFVWGSSFPDFSVLQIAVVNYRAVAPFGSRECHGFMPWESHKIDHYNIGTYRSAGGDITNVVPASTTADNRRPIISECTINDEDCTTVNTALTSKKYSQRYLSSADTINYTLQSNDILPLSTARPYYNSFTSPNFGQTLMPANSVMTVWLYEIPATADAASQEIRHVFVQGQSITQATSSSASALVTARNTEKLKTPLELNLGLPAVVAAEYVCIHKFIIQYTNNNWTITDSIAITGSRSNQVGSPAGNYLTAVTTDATLTGDGSVATPLAVTNPSTGTNTGDETQSTILTKIGYTPENVANKDTTVTLGTSDTKYPSQKAVKTYVDSLSNLTQVRGETPSGLVNGSNTTFTLAATPATGSERGYKNGMRLRSGTGNDYTISGATITMAVAPVAGTIILFDYEVSSGTFAQGVNNFLPPAVPTGLVNGSNTVFTCASSYIGGTLQVYINGILQAPTTHYTETTPSTGVFTMSDAPSTGDNILVVYQHTLSSTGSADTLDGYHANSTPTANTLLPLDSNSKINANLLYNPVKFRVYKSDAQNATSANAVVLFDKASYDTGSNVDISTNKGRFTAPISGFYSFKASVSINTTAAAQIMAIQLNKNGTKVSDGETIYWTSVPGTKELIVTDDLQLNVGDYIEVSVYSYVTQGINTGSSFTKFSGSLISTL